MAPKPYHLLGKCYLLLGDSKTARQWLRKSLKLQPDNPEAVRDYRRAEAMSRGQVSTPASVSESEETSKGGLSGFFGRFRKEKKVADSPAKPNPTSLDDFDFSQFDD
jgi:tetratricopeptide (TPR) repeat protein